MSTDGDLFIQRLYQLLEGLERGFKRVEQVMLDGARETEELRDLIRRQGENIDRVGERIDRLGAKIDGLVDAVLSHERRLREVEDS